MTKAKKTTAAKKSNKREKAVPKSDFTKDPLFKLKPNDIILYTPVYGDGKKGEQEVHIVIDSYFQREPSLAGCHPSLRLVDGKLLSDTLYFFGKEACELEVLTDTHKLDLVVVNKIATWKLSKQRKNSAK